MRTLLPGLEVLLFFFGGSPLLFAQDWVLKNYHAQNGLPTSNVYQCFQDSKGFMWFATEKGLSRFDGYAFTNFTMSDGLSDNEVLSLFEDSRGRLWCLTFNGKPCFWYNGRFYNPDNTPFLKQLCCKSYLSSMAEDEQHTIYIISYKGELAKLTADNQTSNTLLKPFDVRVQMAVLKTYCLNNDLYYQDTGALYVQRQGSEQIENVFYWHKTFPDLYAKKRPIKTAQIGNHTLIGLFVNRLFAMDMQTHQLVCIQEIPQLEKIDVIVVYCIENEIWVCTQNGVYLIEYRNKQFYFKKQYLQEYAVNSVARDLEGNTWFSTQEQGVFFKARNEVWYYGEKHGLISSDIQHITLNTDQELVVGFRREGICTFAKGKIHASHIISQNVNNKGTFYDMVMLDKKQVLCANTIGLILVEQKRVYYIPEIPSKAVAIDKQGRILVGTPKGLYAISRTLLRQMARHVKDSIQTFPVQKEAIYRILEKCQLNDIRVTKLFSTQQGQVYIGRNDGLFMLSAKNTIVPVSFNSQINTRVTDILETKDSTLWITTDGSGIFIYKNGKLKNIRSEQGLVNMNCYALDIDQDGVVWVATNRGVCAFRSSHTTTMIHALTQENGLNSDEIKDILVQGDTVWLASRNGLMFFNRKTIRTSLPAPPVHMASFLVFGKAENKDKRTLRYNENNIQISFVGISYQNNRDMRYRYRLHPNDDWIETQNTQVDLSTLVPDSYRFEVTAKTAQSDWNPETAYITFTINNPFWWEWWFLSVCMCVVLGIGFLGFRVRYNQLKYRIETENKTKLLKIQALVAQINPHFMFNLMGAIQGLIYNQEPLMATTYLAKFSKLIRLILHQSREQLISLSEEIDTLTHYLELQQLRFDHTFEYSFQVDDTIDPETTAIPPMLAQPFIENAIEHGFINRQGAKGHISVRFIHIGEEIMLEIKDNGIGLRKSKELNQNRTHKPKGSLGVQITQERLSILFNKPIPIVMEEIIEGGQVKGTRVAITFPVQDYF